MKTPYQYTCNLFLLQTKTNYFYKVRPRHSKVQCSFLGRSGRFLQNYHSELHILINPFQLIQSLLWILITFVRSIASKGGQITNTFRILPEAVIAKVVKYIDAGCTGKRLIFSFSYCSRWCRLVSTLKITIRFFVRFVGSEKEAGSIRFLNLCHLLKSIR